MVNRLALLVVLAGFVFSAWAQNGPRREGRGMGPDRTASDEVKAPKPTADETLKARCTALQDNLDQIQKEMNKSKEKPHYSSLDTLKKVHQKKLAELLILRGIAGTKDNLTKNLNEPDLKAKVIKENSLLKKIVALTMFDAMDSLFIDVGNKDDFFKDATTEDLFLTNVKTRCEKQTDKKLCIALADSNTTGTTEKMIKGYYNASKMFDEKTGFSSKKLEEFSVFLNENSSLNDPQRAQLKVLLSEVLLNGGHNDKTPLPDYITPAPGKETLDMTLEQEVTSLKKQIERIYNTPDFKNLAIFADATQAKLKEGNCKAKPAEPETKWFDCLPNSQSTLKPFVELFAGVNDVISTIPIDTPLYGTEALKKLCDEKPFTEMNLTVCADLNPPTPEKEYKFFKTKEGQRFLEDLNSSDPSRRRRAKSKPTWQRLMSLGTEGINAFAATDKNAREANAQAQQQQMYQAQMAQAQQQMAMQQQMLMAQQAQNAGQTLGSIGAVGVSNASLMIPPTQLGAMTFTPTRADYISSKYGSFDSKNQFVVRPFNV